VLHTLWDRERLRLWAETSSGAQEVGRRSNGRGKVSGGKAGTRPRMHPFTLEEGPLMEALEGLAGSTVVGGGRVKSLILQLPATSRGPLPSPELILDE